MLHSYRTHGPGKDFRTFMLDSFPGETAILSLSIALHEAVYWTFRYVKLRDFTQS